jgi:hypothetical protein
MAMKFLLVNRGRHRGPHFTSGRAALANPEDAKAPGPPAAGATDAGRVENMKVEGNARERLGFLR